jgi:hypothetical protein
VRELGGKGRGSSKVGRLDIQVGGWLRLYVVVIVIVDVLVDEFSFAGGVSFHPKRIQRVSVVLMEQDSQDICH